LALDPVCRYLDWKIGEKQRLTGHVGRLATDVRVAHDDLIHLRGVDVHSVDDLTHYRGGQLGRLHSAERPAETAYRGPDRAYDDDFLHAHHSLFSAAGAPEAASAAPPVSPGNSAASLFARSWSM
jgi:hypothetical protein